MAEDVFLAFEVLIEGHARTAGKIRDAVDAALVVAHLAEHAQRRVENPLLRALSTRPDLRVVGERRAPKNRARFGIGHGQTSTTHHVEQAGLSASRRRPSRAAHSPAKAELGPGHVAPR